MYSRVISPIMNRLLLPYNPYKGELFLLERIRLYQWICQSRPKVVLEIGTGVGGSTFYISEALRRDGGKLFTCDPHRRPPQEFLDRFEGTLHYRPWTSMQLIADLISAGQSIDFIFFDGPEIPQLALDDIQSLEPHLQSGCRFAMHDWAQAGGKNPRISSIKAAKIRPYLESSTSWTRLDALDGHRKNAWWTRGRFDSVGLCLYEYRKSASHAAKAA